MPTQTRAFSNIAFSRGEIATPVVKWAGGKTRLLPQLLERLPSRSEQARHIEPFAGGAAFFFARRPRQALLSDLNPDLVNTYRAVRDRVDKVIAHLKTLAASHSEGHYYQVREQYNMQSNTAAASPKRAAMFIYLNKTCFNGLHRVNRRGEFNVPFGRYKRPNIVNSQVLERASECLRGVSLRNEGFESLLEYCRPGDFVYLDPPYAPVSSTSFTGYAAQGFGREQQIALRDVYVELDRRGCHLMLSNSGVSEVAQLYQNYNIEEVFVPRFINRNASGRGAIKEFLIRNYQ